MNHFQQNGMAERREAVTEHGLDEEPSLSMKRHFFEHWEEKGFLPCKPISVVHPPAWGQTLFVNTALLGFLDLHQQGQRFPSGLMVCQACVKAGFRNISLAEMMSKDGYLTSFDQLSVAIDYSAQNQRLLTAWLMEFLLVKLSIPADRIIVALPENQSANRHLWEAAGISSGQIIVSAKAAHSFELAEKNISGDYSSVYFDRGNSVTCCEDAADCLPGCGCERYLELGDLGIVDTAAGQILDCGCGLERLVAVHGGNTWVRNLAWLDNGARLGQKLGLDHDQAIIVTDYFRTVALLHGLGVVPGNKKQAYVQRMLIRKILWNCGELSGNSLEEYIFGLGDICTLEPPEKAQLAEVFAAENGQLKSLIARGKQLIQKILERQKLLSAEDLQTLYQTHGIPFEVALEIQRQIGFRL
jgi:alanyl-tRNA synthetase